MGCSQTEADELRIAGQNTNDYQKDGSESEGNSEPTSYSDQWHFNQNERNCGLANGSHDRDETKTCRQRFVHVVKRNIVLCFLIVGIALGIALGFALRYADLTDRQKVYYKLPGDVLIYLTKLLTLPFVASILITNFAALSSRSFIRAGVLIVAYYFLATVQAVLLTSMVVTVLTPGIKLNSSLHTVRRSNDGHFTRTADTVLDLIRNMFPDNLVVATFEQTKSVEVTRGSGATSVVVVGKQDEMNVVGVVFFAVALGISIGRLGDRGRQLVSFFESLMRATEPLVIIVANYSPIAIVFLVSSEIITFTDPVEAVEKLFLYIATVFICLALYSLILLPALFAMIVRENPYHCIISVQEALITAFESASSSIALPDTCRCLEKNSRVDSRVVRYVIPVGVTINIAGTALYEAVAVIFIAQVNDIEMSLGQVIVISLTVSMATLGSPGIPQNLLTLLVSLTAAGLSTDNAAKVITVDWLMYRFRAVVNVLTDCFGARILLKLLSQAQMEEINYTEIY
ncbi:excitatory amino acid transporter 3-like [Tubulanus polymorphus]|uniref:excitatory amino acid transporter 3-like n=1 Tax=Tubulanus polymorphus TaxID=672921 RepID=UPI003DA3714D